MAPIKIESKEDLLNELISLQSALNTRVFENTVMTQDTLLSETFWGEHAMEHLEEIIRYVEQK